jgi:hypothetical protein
MWNIMEDDVMHYELHYTDLAVLDLEKTVHKVQHIGI